MPREATERKSTPLRERRGSAVFEPDLDWLFNFAEGEMGKRAAFVAEPMGPNPEADDRRIEAAAKERRIRVALGSLPDAQIAALRLSHRSPTPGFKLRWSVAFGEFCAVIVGNLASEETSKQLLEDAKSKAKGDEARKAVDWLKDQALDDVTKSVAAYRKSKKESAAATRAEKRRKFEMILRGAA